MIAERREYAIRYIEYTIPSGTYASEVSKAWEKALAEYRTLHRLPEDQAPPADWVRVFALDDEVVFRIEVREGQLPPNGGGH